MRELRGKAGSASHVIKSDSPASLRVSLVCNKNHNNTCDQCMAYVYIYTLKNN